MNRFRSFRAKLQIAFVLLGLAAIGATGWEASTGAAEALRLATYDRLSAVAQTKRRQIERYFHEAGNHVLALSTDESTISALEEFRSAWAALPVTDIDSPRAQSLEEVYRQTFAATGQSARADWRQWMPEDSRARTLQFLTIAANPHPPGLKDQLLSIPGAGAYGQVHARYHPTLHRYQSAFGFYDIFLISAPDGRVLYTVLKEIDIGASLRTNPYDTTSLSRAYRRAMELPQPEMYVVEDYTPYAASSYAPAAFFAAPIWRRGTKIGVLAIQISVAEVNRVMTGDRNWQQEGLGQSGESFIVGSDGLLRSDLRAEIENPARFYKQLAEAGVDPETIARIRTNRTATLNLRVTPPAFTGDTAVSVTGREVLRTTAPLDLRGLGWTLVAELSAEEAFAPVRGLQRRILGWGLLIALAFVAAGALLARSVTRPVLRLAEGAARLGKRDFSVRVPVESNDEISVLGGAFNRMAEDLQRTTASKEELESLTEKLITAQEDERTRLARELHDDVTQRIAATAIEAGRTGATSIKDQLVRLSGDVHRLSRRLHPSALDDLGLVAAIEQECRAFFERGGPPVELSTDAAVDAAPREVLLAIYRIVQEGLNNVLRHSGAEEVSVTLRREDRDIQLTIKDNGRGFDSGDPSWRPGLGLASMEERVRLLGGRFQVESHRDEGTAIRATLPVKEEDGQTTHSAG